jgi:hypothetical protein
MSAQTLRIPHWSADEDARLQRLVGPGSVALETLVPHLPGRSLAAIATRLRRLDLSHRVDLTGYYRSRYRRYRQDGTGGTRRWMRWSAQEDAQLRQAAESRITLDALQSRLGGRTSVAIVARLRALGLADRIEGTQPYFAAWAARAAKPKRKATTRRRPCLHCRQVFRSAGPQNRLCDPCREYAADISPFDIWP